jgi:O-antigen/teichoic acid export membrane protein
MKKNILLAKTIVISGMAAALNYLITFLLTPYITERIGIEAYGFVSIAKTAVSYAQIFTISLTTFVVRYIFMEYHEQNMEEANAYYSSSITGCAAMSGGIFLCCLPVICKLEYFLNIPSELTASVKLLFGIVFFNFVIQTMVTPFQSYAYIATGWILPGSYRCFPIWLTPWAFCACLVCSRQPCGLSVQDL